MDATPGPNAIPAEARILAIERPAPALLLSYAVTSLAGLFLAPLVFLPLFFKYHTLRYRIDAEGISASWGVLFRREIHLTYKRIQDIHVNRSIVERWLGIGRVELQTASGSSSAELVLEGMTEYEGLRDFLYGRMRGQGAGSGAELASAGPKREDERRSGEVLTLLREIRGELEGARRALEARPTGRAGEETR